jgi:succinate dehydrogenase flavin-adding protein (antitoxin of CptAB toxin-antitoxin module)
MLKNYVKNTLFGFFNCFPKRDFIKVGRKFLNSENVEAVPKFKINLSEDYELAKKQVFWRIRNIGQLELEFLLMKWYERQNMNLEQLKQFTEEVLQMENPEMNKYFVKFDAPPENHLYTKQIQHDILNNLYK